MTARFSKNTLIEINQRPYKLLKKIQDKQWTVEDLQTGSYEVFSLKKLHEYLSAGQLVFVNEVKSAADREKAFRESQRNEIALLKLEDKDLDQVKTKRAYVLATDYLFGSEKHMKPVIQEVWVKLGSHGVPPHWSTVVRWRKQLINNAGNALSMLPLNHRKGNRTRRYCAELERIIDDAIDRIYLKPERRTIEDTLGEALVEVEKENRLRPASMQLQLPTRRMVKSRIELIDQFDRYAARHGNLAATKRYRAVLHKNISQRPLEAAEIDHTKLDLMVVDEERGLLLGRPWVTVCIDRYTRCVLGIYISFTPPSFLTVSRCLKHAFLAKTDLREKYPEVDNEWSAYGVMHKLIVDNGLEFHGNGLEKVCHRFGIDLQFTPRKTPWWKGVVERFIGTMNRGVAHGTPGTTFANFLEKDDYDAMSKAVIRFETLKLLVNKWVVDVYHQRPHKSLDLYSPHIKWTSAISDEDISLPENLTSLDAMMGKPSTRRLTHKGIEYEKLFYNSTELVSFFRRFGDKSVVNIRTDEGDLGRIWVISPDESEVIQVPCLDLEYAAGLTLWQHKVCIRYAALYMQKHMGNNTNAWRHAQQEMREIIQRDLLHSKKRTHSKAKRFVGDDQPIYPLTEPKPVKSSQPVTPTPTTPKLETEALELMPPVKSKPATKKFTALIQDRRWQP